MLGVGLPPCAGGIFSPPRARLDDGKGSAGRFGRGRHHRQNVLGGVSITGRTFGEGSASPSGVAEHPWLSPSLAVEPASAGAAGGGWSVPPWVFLQSRWIILGEAGSSRNVGGARKGRLPEEAGCGEPGEARARPAPSCPPWGLPGVAESRLPSSADGPLNYPFLHCLVEEFECAVCAAKRESINPHF